MKAQPIKSQFQNLIPPEIPTSWFDPPPLAGVNFLTYLCVKCHGPGKLSPAGCSISNQGWLETNHAQPQTYCLNLFNSWYNTWSPW